MNHSKGQQPDTGEPFVFQNTITTVLTFSHERDVVVLDPGAPGRVSVGVDEDPVTPGRDQVLRAEAVLDADQATEPGLKIKCQGYSFALALKEAKIYA